MWPRTRPAAAAGLKGGSEKLEVDGQTYCIGGDSITAINGHDVSSLEDLQARISGYAAGDKIKLAVTGGDGASATSRSRWGRCRPPRSHSQPAADTANAAGVPGAPDARYADGVIAEVFEVEGVHCPRCIQKSLRP